MNLTGFAYTWLGLITLAGIYGQWADSAGYDGLWRHLAVGLILGLALEWLEARKRSLTILRQISPTGYLGESLSGFLVFSNQDRRALHIETHQQFPDGLAGDDHTLQTTIPPGQEGHQPFSVVPRKLGRLEWRSVYTRARGRLGLAWWPRRFDIPGAIQILPARLGAHERGTGVQEQGDLSLRAPGTGKELLWLREYRPGDPLRAVDWKATARSGKPIVRVLTEEQRLAIMVLIDAGRTSGLLAGELTRLHHYVNVAARLAEKAAQNGDDTGLVIFAEQPLEVLPPVKDLAGLVQFRRILEKATPSSREANPLTATLTARRLLRRRSLVVIFTETDERDTAGQLVQATKLLVPKHLPLIAGIIDPDTVAFQHRAAHDWLDPYYAFAATEMLQASRANALRVQRMGGFVALASPSKLDGAVLTYYQTLRARRQI